MSGDVFVAVNTVGSTGQIVLLKDSLVVGEKLWEKQKSHSEIVSVAFSELLAECNFVISDITHVFCVNGPGSFTGIRVGINFCRGLAYSLGCPVTTINSLELLAYNSNGDGPILACLDAQKNSVFCSFYQRNDSRLVAQQTNQVIKLSSLTDFIQKPYQVCGDGFDRYLAFLDTTVQGYLDISTNRKSMDLKKYFLHSTSHSQPDLLRWDQLQPLYLKASAPEELSKPSAQ